MSAQATLCFPSVRAAWLPAPQEALPSGLRWRNAHDADLPFLRQLYADSRAAELAAVSWPDTVRDAFLDSQFTLQHRHYTAYYQPADYLVIEYAGQPIGRLYLHCAEHEATVVDIALLDAWSGRGFGSALLREVQRAAVRDALDAVVLHVDLRNHGARKLYERMHFVAEADTGTHLRMRWLATNGLS
ncbi:GNAT family N-acetyltransferase [Dyella jiangningensis]|uniref:GNAT family N-acetyltransferase n=1 Tax=Dyella jiangningensis TaxID=1379159 RepID=A0A328NWR9_9GAMM|nr:GNAT family N-acetyltransferase [Dyella jiangningensis]RAO74758.1 GNAT family N-acetyltransferase [Dyella jiangningensis]